MFITSQALLHFVAHQPSCGKMRIYTQQSIWLKATLNNIPEDLHGWSTRMDVKLLLHL